MALSRKKQETQGDRLIIQPEIDVFHQIQFQNQKSTDSSGGAYDYIVSFKNYKFSLTKIKDSVNVPANKHGATEDIHLKMHINCRALK